VIKVDRHEWVLKSPAHHTEVEKAVDVAGRERAGLIARGVRTGDVQLAAADNEVVVSFEAERPANPTRARGIAAAAGEDSDG
jgi:hypothetical protein